jgi:cyanophycinase-like exopeptidase
MGVGPAYFVLADHFPEVCEPGTPLTYSDYKIWKVLPGQTFDLANRPTAGYYLRSVIDGQISANPY